MIALSEGLTFSYEGGLGMPVGSWDSADEIFDWTSCAAASRLRVRSNWSVMLVSPWVLAEVICATPAMVENCRSSGVATAEAIISGLAPGKVALTTMVG